MWGRRQAGRGAVMTAIVIGTFGCARPSAVIEPAGVGGQDLASQVEVLRTAFGVPHIFADNLRALGFGLGYCQTEDYGERVVHGLVRSNGQLGTIFGVDSIESDFDARRARRLAAETYPLLSQDARDLMEGFAAGVNRYVQRHPVEFARWGNVRFTGEDVHGSFILTTGPNDARRFRARADSGTAVIFPATEDGSNAWALAPSRTASGNAILLRNPHLSWDAGYYEVHLVVPGMLNWYGDVRIGQPLYYIGGFNERLGWATTNNEPDLDEVYAFDADTTRAGSYILDGRPIPLQREVVTVEFRSDTGAATATREVWKTPFGPVIDRRDGKILVFTAGYDGAFRMVDQYLGMIRARNLEEWLDAMRTRAHESSNFTYADADGNIFYLWNASLPDRPHPPAGDTAAVLVHRSSQMWHDLVPFDALPRLRNPKGGYTHNENDPFYFTNLNEPFDTTAFGPNFPRPRLRLRSQLGLQLINSLPAKATLEDVIAQKHIPRMLLADRLKEDLVAAVRESDPTGDVRDAVELLEGWDNTTARESRGGVLFQTWYTGYLEGAGSDEPRAPDWRTAQAFRVPWRSEEPTTTPRGLGDPAAAVRAFEWAVAEMLETYGAIDVSWGEVHRARRGDLDLPVSGCPGSMGCFRTIYFDDAEDGRKVASGGDGWVFAVEFGDMPRAYSVLAYGESDRADSPHSTDQLLMFTEGRMKEVAFSRADIERQLIRRYRPGHE